MKKILTLAVIFCTLVICGIASAAAQVTDARWGVNADNVLRLVVDLSGSATYQIKMSDPNRLNLVVDAPSAPSAFKSSPVKSTVASSMRVYEEGVKTIVELALTKPVTEKDYKSFVLKTDPRNGRPNRIVLDVIVDKKVASSNVTSSTEKTVVSATSASTPSKESTATGTINSHQVSTIPQNNNSKPVVSTRPTNRRPVVIKAPNVDTNTNTNNSGASGTSNSSITASTKTTPTPVNNTTNTTVASASGKTPVTANTTVASTIEQNPKTEIKKTVVRKGDKRRDVKVIAKENNKNKKTTPAVTNTKTTEPKKEPGIPALRATKKYTVNGGIKGKTIVLDAGHGGTDPGAIGASGLKEKDVTLPIAMLLKKELEEKGAKVFMTRTTDVDVCKPGATDRDELQARVNVAEKNNCDAFISIHINSSVNKTVGGFSSYYHPKTPYDIQLARFIQNKLVKNFNVNDLGVREAGFYVIKRSSMPATLLELCFISNPGEEKLIQSGWFRKKAAGVIADGIEEYFK